MLRPAVTHPRATAQQPGKKGRESLGNHVFGSHLSREIYNFITFSIMDFSRDAINRVSTSFTLPPLVPLQKIFGGRFLIDFHMQDWVHMSSCLIMFMVLSQSEDGSSIFWK